MIDASTNAMLDASTDAMHALPPACHMHRTSQTHSQGGRGGETGRQGGWGGEYMAVELWLLLLLLLLLLLPLLPSHTPSVSFYSTTISGVASPSAPAPTSASSTSISSQPKDGPAATSPCLTGRCRMSVRISAAASRGSRAYSAKAARYFSGRAGRACPVRRS
jgi:hypothetical protein